jgi:hypothetical protein
MEQRARRLRDAEIERHMLVDIRVADVNVGTT